MAWWAPLSHSFASFRQLALVFVAGLAKLVSKQAQLRAILGRIRRVSKNVFFDLRYGGFLGGTRASSAQEIGGVEAGNSDYDALQAIFANLDIDGRVIADVGAGRGRVANFILDNFNPKKIILIEYDRRIASKLHRRLGQRKNVIVKNGDFRSVSLDNIDVFYLFNPFDKNLMIDFIHQLPSIFDYIIYYNPARLFCFSDQEFEVSYLLKNHAEYHDCVLIRRRGAGRAALALGKGHLKSGSSAPRGQVKALSGSR